MAKCKLFTTFDKNKWLFASLLWTTTKTKSKTVNAQNVANLFALIRTSSASVKTYAHCWIWNSKFITSKTTKLWIFGFRLFSRILFTKADATNRLVRVTIRNSTTTNFFDCSTWMKRRKRNSNQLNFHWMRRMNTRTLSICIVFDAHWIQQIP